MYIAKWIIAFVAVYNFGGLLFDAVIPVTAKQHLWNDRWRPHAKFHNAQTMMMGIVSGTIALVLLFAPGPLTPWRFAAATAVAANYWVSMTIGGWFPGVLWSDPEFDDINPRPLGLHVQQLLTYVLVGLVVVAIGLALLIR